MARPKRAAKPELATEAEDSGASTDETSAIEDGKILDYVTGKPVAENDKERVRQRIARALFHEYGISVDDMEPDFKVKVEESGKSSNKKIDIAIFEPGSEHTPENVRRFWAGRFEKNGQLIDEQFDPEGQKAIRKRILPLFEEDDDLPLIAGAYQDFRKRNKEPGA